jgi:hypothetical protein
LSVRVGFSAILWLAGTSQKAAGREVRLQIARCKLKIEILTIDGISLVARQIGMPMFKITVTIDKATLRELDRLVRQRWFPSRSGAIAEAIK